MPIHFSRSLRRLDADGSRRSALSLSLTFIVLGLWVAWFVTARVGIYASTGSARLEVDRENHPVDAPITGRVLSAPVVAGQRVTAGDVLLELDANPERLARNEALAKLAPATQQIASLEEELTAAQDALDQELRSAAAANAESEAKARESAAAAELAVEESKRLADLRTNGLVSELDALRSQKEAEQKQNEAHSMEFAASRLARDLDARREDRLARIARLRNELAAIRGARGEATAASDRLDYQIGQRQVRAPITGTLAEMSPLKVGSVVQQGDRICTVVPDGALKVVALFAPSIALGRVRPGQTARIKLEGFPWTEYGTAPARVSNVAGELRDGQIRVDLALGEMKDSAIPLQHGLPAQVDVEIEQVSPLTMVLRSAGTRMHLRAAPDSALH